MAKMRVDFAEACARFKLKCNEPRYAMTAIEYKGHRIEVSPVGKGWKAAIFAPGSTRQWLIAPPIWRKAALRKLLQRPSALSMRGLAQPSHGSDPQVFPFRQ